MANTAFRRAGAQTAVAHFLAVDVTPRSRPRVGSFRYFAAADSWEWSDEVAPMHGYQPGSVTPTNDLVLSHRHPADMLAVAELIEQMRCNRVAFSSRHRIVATDGTVHPVIVVGDRMYDDNGGARGTYGFYLDATDPGNNDVQGALTEAVAAIDERRAVINQAIGILMMRHRISAEGAFDKLVTLSQTSNIKLRTLAERFVSRAQAVGSLSRESAAAIDTLFRTATNPTPDSPDP